MRETKESCFSVFKGHWTLYNIEIHDVSPKSLSLILEVYMCKVSQSLLELGMLINANNISTKDNSGN